MDHPDLDSPNEVLQWLSEPIRALRAGLEHGLSLADAKMEDLPREPHLHAHLARVGVLMYLAGITAERWEIGRKLPLSGIEIQCNPFVLRVLRSQRGSTPHPGASEARRRFWCQQQLRLFDQAEPPSLGANLILDWSTGDQQDIILALSKPRGVWPYQGSPELEWRRAVVDDSGPALRFVPAEEDIAVDFDLTEIEEQGDDDWGAHSTGA